MRGRKPNVTAHDGGNVAGIEYKPIKRPTQLMGKPAALGEWKRLSVVLQEKGLWARTDQSIMVAYCESYQDFVDAAQEVKEHGLLIDGDRGGKKSNPAVRMKKAALDTMVRILAELGLTPTGSMRAGSVEPGEDAFDELINRRKG